MTSFCPAQFAFGLITAWCALATPASAARLLHATIEQDGQIVLRTAYQDQGTAEAATVWRYLAKGPLWAEKGAGIKAAADDPRKSRLTGAITVRVSHVDHTIALVKTSELNLVRANPDTEEWHLPPAEVERLAKANAIPDPPVLAFFDRNEVRIGLAIAAAVIVAGIAWVIVRGGWLRA